MTPTTADPARHNITTSYDDGVAPEQALAVAVILQAIHDLGSSDELVRFEAHEFFLQPKGPWAEMRQFYFSAVQLDDEWLHEHLARRLDPPERPDKKWTYEEVLEILPRDRAFTCPAECKRTTLHPSQINVRVQHLIRHGHVVRLQPGLFCVTEFEEQWRASQLPAPDEKPPRGLGGKTPAQNIVLEALLDGPLTAREIQIKSGGGSYDILRAMVLAGLLEKEGTLYQIAPQSAVAA